VHPQRHQLLLLYFPPVRYQCHVHTDIKSLKYGKLVVKDFFAINQSGATGSIALTHGTVAGNIVTLSVPQAQLKTPTYQEQDQIVMLAMEIMGLPTSAGNNEFRLTLT
jgi:hypothetical protein